MIQHKIIENSIESQDLVIDVLINADYLEIENVTLYYKSPNQFNYLEKNMVHKKDNFFDVTIPGTHITEANLEYYITLELKNNQIYSFPYENPKNNPILVKINKIDDTGKKSKSKFSTMVDISKSIGVGTSKLKQIKSINVLRNPMYFETGWKIWHWLKYIILSEFSFPAAIDPKH